MMKPDKIQSDTVRMAIFEMADRFCLAPIVEDVGAL